MHSDGNMTITHLRPVTKQSAETQALESLRDFILSGSVKPGSRVTEIALAEQLGIARATLRTGLHRLAGEGILIQIPYTGWQVPELSADGAWELWTVRGSLERLAARLVTQSDDEKVKRGIKIAFESLRKACLGDNMRRISECDYNLHLALINLSGHSLLQRQYELLHHQVRLFISTSNDYVAEGPADVLQQHEPLMNAILSGDVQRAEHEAWRHNEEEGYRLHRWLTERERR